MIYCYTLKLGILYILTYINCNICVPKLFHINIIRLSQMMCHRALRRQPSDRLDAAQAALEFWASQGVGAAYMCCHLSAIASWHCSAPACSCEGKLPFAACKLEWRALCGKGQNQTGVLIILFSFIPPKRQRWQTAPNVISF